LGESSAQELSEIHKEELWGLNEVSESGSALSSKHKALSPTPSTTKKKKPL
jgi:hypothetical protein